jgi:predicted transcriptional regulator
MSDLSKPQKIKIILQEVAKRKISTYELAKKTGLNESGLGRLFKNEISNPHKSTIDTLYSYLTSIDKSEQNNLLDSEVNEIVYKIVNNEERFMQEKAFANLIEIRVAKKIAKILSNPEDFEKWKNT